MSATKLSPGGPRPGALLPQGGQGSAPNASLAARSRWGLGGPGHTAASLQRPQDRLLLLSEPKHQRQQRGTRLLRGRAGARVTGQWALWPQSAPVPGRGAACSPRTEQEGPGTELGAYKHPHVRGSAWSRRLPPLLVGPCPCLSPCVSAVIHRARSLLQLERGWVTPSLGLHTSGFTRPARSAAPWRHGGSTAKGSLSVPTKPSRCDGQWPRRLMLPGRPLLTLTNHRGATWRASRAKGRAGRLTLSPTCPASRRQATASPPPPGPHRLLVLGPKPTVPCQFKALNLPPQPPIWRGHGDQASPVPASLTC